MSDELIEKYENMLKMEMDEIADKRHLAPRCPTCGKRMATIGNNTIGHIRACMEHGHVHVQWRHFNDVHPNGVMYRIDRELTSTIVR